MKHTPVNELISKTGLRLLLPFYHCISNQTFPHFRYLNIHKNIKDFEKDLDFFLKHYKPISLEELIHIFNSNTPITKNIFHLTFDDGMREISDIVAPILEKKGIPATFFLNNNFIDNKDLFYRFKASILVDKLNDKSFLNIGYNNRNELDNIAKKHNIDFKEYLAKYQPYLTTYQISSLIKKGFTIGGHSLNHPTYYAIPFDEQVKQTINSVLELTNTFNLNYKVFAFPFTDYKINQSFFNKINNHIDLTFGSAGLKHDIVKTNLQRLSFEENLGAEKILKTNIGYYKLKALLNKNTINRS